MSYSPVISFMMDRISGFSTSSFRLQCLGSDTATANQIVRFELPSNACRRSQILFCYEISG